MSFRQWFTLPIAGGAFATVLVTVLTISLWAPQSDKDEETGTRLVSQTQPATGDSNNRFSILSEEEVNMDEYDELVWQELLLAEDELAFAML